MDTKSNKFKLDFMPIGQDIKQAREAREMTREQLSEIIDYVPRHIQALKNEGQTPSVDLLFQLAEMFDVSLDRHIFKDRDGVRSPLGHPNRKKSGRRDVVHSHCPAIAPDP